MNIRTYAYLFDFSMSFESSQPWDLGVVGGKAASVLQALPSSKSRLLN
jgi:hypothetical protein